MSLHSLMFGWEYPPLHLGGLGVACQGLVHGLLRNGVKVTLVLPHPHGEDEGHDVISPTKENIENIKIQSMLSPYETNNSYIKRIAKVSKEMAEIYGNDLPQAVAHFTSMSVDMTRHTNPDVVHCHDWMTYGAGIQASVHHRKPLVAHIHATELDRTHFAPNGWIYEQELNGFNAADKIIAVSGYTKNILVEHYGINPDKVSVVHNGNSDMYNPEAVNLNSEFRKQNKNPLILFLGRLTLQKGANQFLDMAVRVHSIRPDVRFVIAGDGGMMDELVNRTCELGLRDYVAFVGKVSNSEARKLYAAASCFVMPSLSEPFGLVALEAIAQGTPVILSKQSGASEVVGHSFKVDFWDTEMMADCALTILREEPLAEQLRSEAPSTLHRLTWQNQAGHVYDIYKNLT